MYMKQKPAKGLPIVAAPKPAPKEGPMSYQQGFASAGSL
jgi:hypothetical protein